jgi:hypothetical protein
MKLKSRFKIGDVVQFAGRRHLIDARRWIEHPGCGDHGFQYMLDCPGYGWVHQENLKELSVLDRLAEIA